MSPRYEGLDIFRAVASFGVVLLHVHVSVGHPESLSWLIKLRDFALPLMVMSSFFLLTISLTRKPHNNFRAFFNKRLKRLWIPFIVWTIIYCVIWAFFVPAILGDKSIGILPSSSVFLTGYMHLWFLQFIFAGSLLIYPLLCFGAENKNFSRLKLLIFCFLSTLIYAILFHSLLKHYTDWEYSNPDLDANLRLFISQVSAYILYVPVGIGIGLAADKVNKIFDFSIWRLLSAAVAVFAAIIHTIEYEIPLSRELYGISVFLFAIQPWRKLRLNFVYTLAAYSYGIYILHFGMAQGLSLLAHYQIVELNEIGIVAASVIIYTLSFATAFMLRRLTPWNYFLPLVPVNSSKTVQT